MIWGGLYEELERKSIKQNITNMENTVAYGCSKNLSKKNNQRYKLKS